MKDNEKFIIGKKIGMTQIFDEEGNRISVTVIEAGPCVIVQKKNVKKEGYDALQIGFEARKVKNLSKPIEGHLASHKIDAKLKIFKEFKVKDISKYNEGDLINVNVFQENDVVDIHGVSIGKGFQGTVKRWHFNVGPMAHGSKNHRIPGSIGAGSGQSRVLKGKKMYGHMGDRNVTVKRIKIVKIMPEDNVILVMGSVPGKKNSVVTVTA
ncbi:MAG: 50S ribosomal protein L3 [Candidatus Margulisiibacteriota bacterium]|nr:MAG: 50S ribosomal protein L3 [Candidatus Margulisbacteria bacterium GWD2_39_127]PZM79801.1 MAG: 50S ribosomal protein L3 [Candidatus Margulisiibacteriota bacterium]HAR62708.1 50S ribosomal protein L3 [Candidatus Margulisiibacteriota bacterium]HCY36797.1 50S ribosomal protein L3 [Candidatus Margulisiibacteriota bacterium]